MKNDNLPSLSYNDLVYLKQQIPENIDILRNKINELVQQINEIQKQLSYVIDYVNHHQKNIEKARNILKENL